MLQLGRSLLDAREILLSWSDLISKDLEIRNMPIDTQDLSLLNDANANLQAAVISLTEENRSLQAGLVKMMKTQNDMYNLLQQVYETQSVQTSGKKRRICDSGEKEAARNDDQPLIAGSSSSGAECSAAIFSTVIRSKPQILYYRQSMSSVTVHEVLTDNVFYKLWQESSWDPRQNTSQLRKIKSSYSAVVSYFREFAKKGICNDVADSTLATDLSLLETKKALTAREPSYLEWHNCITDAAERLAKKGIAAIASREEKAKIKSVTGIGACSFVKRVSTLDKIEKENIKNIRAVPAIFSDRYNLGQ